MMVELSMYNFLKSCSRLDVLSSTAKLQRYRHIRCLNLGTTLERFFASFTIRRYILIWGDSFKTSLRETLL